MDDQLVELVLFGLQGLVVVGVLLVRPLSYLHCFSPEFTLRLLLLAEFLPQFDELPGHLVVLSRGVSEVVLYKLDLCPEL